MFDIVFHCDASPTTGFGHVARSAHLTALLQTRRPSLSVAFQGAIDAGAQNVATLLADRVSILEGGISATATLSVIDRMADHEDPDIWDEDHISQVISASRDVCFIASGTQEPALPASVYCLGYQPMNSPIKRARTEWGLQFAPIPPRPNPAKGTRELPQQNRALVALGGASSERPISTVLNALEATGRIDVVDVLLSPVGAKPVLEFAPSRIDLTLHRGIADIYPLFRQAALVVASYGNLMFEALADGAAVCVVGQKEMQVTLASRLAEYGYISNGGMVDDSRSNDITAAIVATLDQAEAMTQKAAVALEGAGLARIAERLEQIFIDAETTSVS